MKQPCKSCPFRKDVKPFLTPERGEQLAYHATNEYNSFPCHKTTVKDPDNDDEMMVVETSKECAGFKTLQINETGKLVKGFTPSNLVYSDILQMIQAYENQ